MTTLPFATVTTQDQLNQDLAAIAGSSGSYTITFGAGITLNADLLAVNLGSSGSLTQLSHHFGSDDLKVAGFRRFI